MYIYGCLERLMRYSGFQMACLKVIDHNNRGEMEREWVAIYYFIHLSHQ